jgi:D-sedoheptulose 7-phosphate isomerase
VSASGLDEAGQLFELRSAPVSDFAAQAEAVARACHAMALRFHRGGKLVVFGVGAPSTDAQHVAVEFVHPVIVGKRALPAISLTTGPSRPTSRSASVRTAAVRASFPGCRRRTSSAC